MSKPNYRQIYARKDKALNELRQICPEAAVHRSGIYFYTREDTDGKHAYIGKAVDLANRLVSHMNGYKQHIDISLKSRGYYSDINPSGWKLYVLYYPRTDLDKYERYWIERYQKAGVHLYNIESGGSAGKTDIAERKPPKTYRDGLLQGRKSLAKELRHIIDTHLEVKPRKENKITQKALSKFWELLK